MSADVRHPTTSARVLTHKKSTLLKRLFNILLVIAVVFAALSCSTNKNTASTRRWQAFVTRYNVYFNAEQAYIEGRQAQDKGLKENYTERLPLFGVGYEKQRSLGKSNFETAVTKCEKAIQLHSIKKKPVAKAGKAQTPQQKAYLSRKEFNPFLKNAWMLMGKAQFQKGEFSEAAATFAYITRFYAPEPDVVAEARIWLARCYAELDWFYDAEDVIQRMDRDSMPSRLSSERALTLADYYIRQDKLEEALPYLQRVAKKEKSKARKARVYYLLGQTYMALDRKADAYKALSKCIAQSPAYEMSFHARILQTEALTTSANAKSMIKRLKRMSKKDTNKDYLDQIYYAIGNIQLQQNDTLQAISAYETGREKATQKGPETALLLLRLGGIYWEQRRFDKAQPCYTEAIGLLDKTHDDYKEITHRSKVLDALVPPTSAIQLQDSLQWLASLDEPQRNEAIDRVIEALKKKEAEEKKARRDSLAEERQKNRGDNNGGSDMGGNMDGPKPGMGGVGSDGEWYFYSQQQVMQGKQAFKKEWGNRKNEDDWRRNNRTVIASTANEAYDYEAADSIAAVQEALRDSLMATGMSEKEARRWIRDHEDGEAGNDDGEKDEKKELSPEEDPHQREYYLAQIPFTPEQKAESDSIIRESLYEAGVIEKDQLEDFPLSAETFGRLERQFPMFDKMDEATYHLFLLYSRWAEKELREGRADQAQLYKSRAEAYREKMRTSYPNHAMTSVICDPDFERNSRFGRELEDSLYTQTYDAYRRGDNELVARNTEISAKKFPKGANRPKFIFIDALSKLGTEPADSISKQLRDLVTEYPKSDVAEMAGMIVKGLEAGRTIGSGGFDLGSLWNRRTAATEAGAATSEEERALSPDRTLPFVFLIAYETTDVTVDDALLYDLARFNFSTYVYRSFDISKEREKGLTQFRVSGFRDFDDVHNYAQRIFRDERLAAHFRGKRIEIISEKNLEKLGTYYSFEDYRTFYDANFVPLDINPELPLEFAPEDDGIEYEDATPEAGVIYTPKGQKPSGAAVGKTADDAPEAGRSMTDENGEPILDDDPLMPQQYDGEDYTDDDAPKTNAKAGDDEFIVTDDAPAKGAQQSGDDEFIVTDDAPAKGAKKVDDEFIVVDDKPAKGAQKTSDDEFIVADDKPARGAKKVDDEYIIADDKPAKGTKKNDDDVFILDDGKNAKNAKKKDDDEYILDDTPRTTKTSNNGEIYSE